MAWYDIFRYENASDKYIRMERERGKEYRQRKAQAKVTLPRFDEPEPEPEIAREPYEPQESEWSPQTVAQEYVFNKSTLFKDLKEPDFTKLTKVKTTKPTRNFGSYLAKFNARPLLKPKTVYKFQTVDQDSGASVITEQKEIEVYGENEHNYYYVTKEGVQSVSKMEVSNSPIDPEALQHRFMSDINEQAKKIARLATPDKDKTIEAPGPKTRKQVEQDFWEGADSGLRAFLAGFGHELTGPLRAAGDFLTAEDSPKKLRLGAQSALHEVAPMFVGDPVTDPWIKEDDKGYIHEPMPAMKLKLKDGEFTEESKEQLKKYDKWQKEAEKHPYPKGYSRETDAMAAGKSKAEIAQAREADKEATIKVLMDKDPDYELTLKDQIGVGVGEVAATVLEFIALGGIGKGIATGLTKHRVAAHIIENLITGGSYGMLEKINERDATGKDYVQSMAKEAVFFTVGSGVSKAIGKALGPAKSIKGALGKGTLKGLGFGAAGTGAAYPFMTEEEKTPENIAMMVGSGALFDAGGAVIGRGVQGLRGKVKPKTLKPLSEIDKKFKLDTTLKGLSKSKKVKLADETQAKMLNEIGTRVKTKVGSSDPKQIVKYYAKKYDLGKDAKITVDKTLTGEKNYASIEIIRENGKIKELQVRINKDKTENEVVAGLRHEIEHALDTSRGYKKPSKDTLVKRPGTLREFMAKGKHHEKYDNFEIEYLENIYNNEIKVKAVDTARKMQLREEIKTTTGTEQQKLVQEFKALKQREVQRERMAIETFGKTTNLANEKLHARNRKITMASNLPEYVEPKQKMGTKFKDFWHKFYAKMVNRQHSIDRTGKKVRMTSQNYIKHHATSAHINNTQLVSRTGDPIRDKSLKDVLVAPKGFQAEYESYLFHKHHISRMDKGKPVLFKPGKDGKEEPISIEEAKKIVKQYEKQFPEFKKHSQDLNQFMDDFMREWMVDSGLITAAEYKTMKHLYPDYVPTYRDIKDLGFDPKIGAVKASPLKKAEGGSEPLLPIVEALPFHIQKIVRAERRNQIHKEIVTAILENPNDMRKFAQLVPSENLGKMKGDLMSRVNEFADKKFTLGELSKKFDETLISGGDIKGNFMISMENGKPLTVKINDKGLWDALTRVQNANVGNQIAPLRIFNKFATKPFKGTVTQYNPFFPVRNIIRDIPTAYVQGSQHEPFTFTARLFKAGYDKFFKTDLYKKFEALGGPSSNITAIERVENSLRKQSGIRKGVNHILKFLNLAGDYSESMPRFAEFKYVYKKGIKKGMSEEQALREALYKADEVTINFSRGGSYTKEIEPIIPYMNAGVQGFDKWMRSLFVEGVAKGNFAPMLKAFGVTMVPTVGLHILNSRVNKSGYDDLPDYLVDHYYVVPTSDGSYRKYPKTRENGFIFSTLFQRMHRHFIENDPDAFKNLDETFIRTYLDPVGQTTKGGFLGPVINLANEGNKDYFGRPIEPLGDVLAKKSKRYITKEHTSKASKAMAPILEKMGFSPAQADYFVKSYSGVLGDMYLAINDSEDTWKEKIRRITHWYHDPQYGGKASEKVYEAREDAQRAVSDFEAEKGIDEYKKKLREQGITSTKIINRKIRERIGSASYSRYLKLKEKRTELANE